MITHQEASVLNATLSTSYAILRKANFAEIEDGLTRESLFALLMINLKEALMILDKRGHRVSFNDDLPNGVDVTKQICTMRNSICHIGSIQRQVGRLGAVLSFGMAIGQGNLAQIDDIVLSNPYRDDIAFFYGTQRILLKRHLARALIIAMDCAPNLVKSAGHHWYDIR